MFLERSCNGKLLAKFALDLTVPSLNEQFLPSMECLTCPEKTKIDLMHDWMVGVTGIAGKKGNPVLYMSSLWETYMGDTYILPEMCYLGYDLGGHRAVSATAASLVMPVVEMLSRRIWSANGLQIARIALIILK